MQGSLGGGRSRVFAVAVKAEGHGVHTTAARAGSTLCGRSDRSGAKDTRKGGRDHMPRSELTCRTRSTRSTQRMLVVRWREETDCPPPGGVVQGMGSPGKGDVEGNWEGVRVETPKGPRQSDGYGRTRTRRSEDDEDGRTRLKGISFLCYLCSFLCLNILRRPWGEGDG